MIGSSMKALYIYVISFGQKFFDHRTQFDRNIRSKTLSLIQALRCKRKIARVTAAQHSASTSIFTVDIGGHWKILSIYGE